MNSMKTWGSAIIILGQKLLPNASISQMLQTRLDVGIQLWRSLIGQISNDNTIETANSCNLILSGSDVAKVGQSEALAMRSYLLTHCEEINKTYSKWLRGRECDEIPINQSLVVDTDSLSCPILLEIQSKNTIENALYCKPIIEALNCRELYVVSSDFHLIRTKCIFDHILSHSNSYNTSQYHMDINYITAPGNLRTSYQCLLNRSHDIATWSSRELLDLELKAILSLNNHFQTLGLPLLPQPTIDDAIQQLRTLNDTLRITN
jgi:hypothetical protein